MIAGTLGIPVRHTRGDPVVSDGVRAAADAVARRLGKLKPRAAIVLGSGLAGVAERCATPCGSRTRIPGLPEPARRATRRVVRRTLEGVRSCAERSLSFV